MLVNIIISVLFSFIYKTLLPGHAGAHNPPHYARTGGTRLQTGGHGYPRSQASAQISSHSHLGRGLGTRLQQAAGQLNTRSDE